MALAGDAFDGRIVRHLVTPELGRGSMYRSPYGQVLPIGATYYMRLERWHYLSVLKAPATIARLKALERTALEPGKIAGLIHIVEDDLGYILFKAVEDTKIDLSAAETAHFAFVSPPTSIRKDALRREFERWIGRALGSIRDAVDRLMASVEIRAQDIDAVFLTGGSSFVPAVRQIFVERFGAEKIRMGSEFTSVARGLALRALDAV